MTLAFAWLWQGLAIALVTALVLHRMKHLSAATRYAIWWLALAAVVVLPIVPLALSPSVVSVFGAHAEVAEGSAAVIVQELPRWATLGAFAIWLAAMAYGLARIANGLRVVGRLKHDSMPFDGDRQRRLTMWTSARARRRGELRVADTASGASALGFIRPVILISRPLADTLDDERLDQIVIHEQAHLERHDDWSRLAQAFIAAVAGLHPAVRFINHQIDLEREAACDDRVVWRTGAPKQYAACLADVAAVSIASVESAMIPTAIGSPRMLLVRVNRLLDPERRRTIRAARAACAGGVLLFLGIVVVSKEMRPVVMFVPPIAADARVSPPQRASHAAVEREREPAPDRNPTRVMSARARPPLNPRVPELAPLRIPARAIEQTSESRTTIERPAQLEATHLAMGYEIPGAPDVPRRPAADGEAPWDAAANAGIVIGGGAKRSGLAVGAFFTRAGKAIANSF